MDIDGEMKKTVKNMIVVPFVAVDAIMGILIAIGGILFIGAIVKMITSNKSA